MGREDMRAADGDRQRVADLLRAALDEGRLDLHEFDERLQLAYAAKTYGELDGLLADLPSTVPVQQSHVVPLSGAAPVPGRPRSAAAYPDATRQWLIETWNGYVGVVMITMVIWAITSIANTEWLYFWPIWVAGPWGAVLVWQTVIGLSSGEPQRQAEKRARKASAKDREHESRRKRQALESADPDTDEGRPALG